MMKISLFMVKFVILFCANVHIGSSWMYWYDNTDCQQMCYEMVDHKTFIKSVVYTDCLENKSTIYDMTHLEKSRCIDNLKMNTEYYFQNDHYRCSNKLQSNKIMSTSRILNRYQKIWVQCDGMCGTNCYHDAILDSTPLIGPRNKIGDRSFSISDLILYNRAKKSVNDTRIP